MIIKRSTIKRIISEAMRRESEAQIRQLVDALNTIPEVQIDYQPGRKIRVEILQHSYDEISEYNVYTYHIDSKSLTQGFISSDDYGSPHPFFGGEEAYISENPQSELEFLKIVQRYM